jgi:hypothetical protein
MCGQIDTLHNEAGDILKQLEATFPRRSSAVPQYEGPAQPNPCAGQYAARTHILARCVAIPLAHELDIYVYIHAYFLYVHLFVLYIYTLPGPSLCTRDETKASG